MRDYVFVLGRNPDLSILEIISYLNTFKLIWELKEFNEEVAVFRIKDFDYAKAMLRLGGVIKIGVVVSEGKFDDLEIYDGSKNKLNYAISSYGDPVYLDKLIDYLKIWFKKNKIKANKKGGKKLSLTPKDLNKNILEFILFDKYVAKTVVISNPSEYKKRDEERPVNDFLRSVSIRLAKILINLSQSKEGSDLLDPFCGIGVILEEALLMNINVSGIEIDSKISRFASKNLKFIAKKYSTKGSFKVYNDDALNVKKIFSKGSIDSVVSEPYLGPYWKKVPPKQEALKVISELEILYLKFFESLNQVLKKKGRVVIMMPIIKTDKGNLKVNFDNILNKTGFRTVNLHNQFKFPIAYEKKGSFIEREIYVLELI